MKKLVLSALLCSSVYGSQAQSPTLQWARQMGGSDYDAGNAIAVDASGNVYTTGYFAGVADFDLGPGTATLSCSGSYSAFLTKFDASGNFIWAKNIADGDQEAYAQSIKTDAAGNIYVGGIFDGTADFDPGAATNTVTSTGFNDIFISKLDASGNLLWARTIGGSNYDGLSAIYLDASSNIYVAGSFMSTVDFDPGASTYTLTAANTDIFALKLNPAGNFVWAMQMAGSGSNNASYITGSSSGKLYLSGSFENSVDFDPGAATYSLTATGNYDAFIMQLDAATGAFGWAGQIGGAGTYTYIYGLTADAASNVYLTGTFSGTIDLDPGAGVQNETSAGNSDMFVSKLSGSGALIWEKTFGGASDDYAYAIALDASNNIYFTGSFEGTVDFDPGAASYTVTAEGSDDLFINKLDASGNLAWATTYGGLFSEVYGYGIHVDASANIIATGSFNYIEDFDPTANTYTLSSVGYTDAFTIKLNQCQAPAAPVITSTTTAALTICAGNAANLTATGTGTISWYASPTTTTALATGTAYTTPTLTAGSYTYYAAAQTCTSSATRTSVTVTVSTCTGIEHADGAGAAISLYPNPVSDKLYLKSDSYDSGTVTVYDLLGNLVAEQGFAAGASSIDLGTLRSGIYLVKLSNAQHKQLLVKRIIKE